MDNRPNNPEVETGSQATESPPRGPLPERDKNKHWWRDRRFIALLGAIAAFAPPLTVAASAMITGYWEATIQRQRQEHEIVTSYLDRAIDENRNGESRRQVLRFIKYSQTGGLQEWAAAELIDLDSAREQRINELELELNACSRSAVSTPEPAVLSEGDQRGEAIASDSGALQDSDNDAEHVQVELDRLAKDIKFGPNTENLLPTSLPSLNAAAELLKKHRDLQVRVEGHYDDRNTGNENLTISRKRAKAIVDYLVHQGVDKHRLSPVGIGKTSPIASNLTPQGREDNRRIEFKVLRAED